MSITELKCLNCGAALNPSGSCPYCGSRYKIPDEIGAVRLVPVYTSPVKTIAAERVIPYWQATDIPAERLSEYSLKELSHQLAEGLAAFMRLNTRNDPFTQAMIIRGEVRVVPPDFRF